MHLPNAERATIDDAKARDYLLSPDHRVGRSKARFFGALGFTQAAWPALRDALLAVAQEGKAEPSEANVFGQKYVVRGIVSGPSGRAAAIVTVWIVLSGKDIPGFVTAYPDEVSR